MSHENDPDEPYDVGYKKPPKHTQWQKGQSGNPTGKKKKEQSLLVQLKRLSAKEIVVHQNGVAVKMTQGEAMLVAVFNKAMNGDLGSIKFISQILGISDADLSASKAPELSENLLGVLETYADWVGVVETARSELAEKSDHLENEGNDDAAY
ncbi:hypothetical protein RUE5091_00581 [Ruegeria denitrificans]|uniref:DUF5681 domain-containing protein n=1 Tax=Ruegeria denitrificans TaxID=1715692 RepID=A0A0P1I2S9_9RHOB|nr:DUF5681 domain-containing protein [Ruegeria denitrificans]CUJ87234.1 hypothetical protein RUE5091_00581 [Ruegeria denitrificans]